MHLWCCVYIECVHVIMQCYVQDGTNRVVRILHMGCCIHIVLSSLRICGMCAYGAMYMLYMWYCVHIVLCAYGAMRMLDM